MTIKFLNTDKINKIINKYFSLNDDDLKKFHFYLQTEKIGIVDTDEIEIKEQIKNIINYYDLSGPDAQQLIPLNSIFATSDYVLNFINKHINNLYATKEIENLVKLIDNGEIKIKKHNIFLDLCNIDFDYDLFNAKKIQSISVTQNISNLEDKLYNLGEKINDPYASNKDIKEKYQEVLSDFYNVSDYINLIKLKSDLLKILHNLLSKLENLYFNNTDMSSIVEHYMLIFNELFKANDIIAYNTILEIKNILDEECIKILKEISGEEYNNIEDYLSNKKICIPFKEIENEVKYFFNNILVIETNNKKYQEIYLNILNELKSENYHIKNEAVRFFTDIQTEYLIEKNKLKEDKKNESNSISVNNKTDNEFIKDIGFTLSILGGSKLLENIKFNNKINKNYENKIKTEEIKEIIELKNEISA